LFYNLMVRRSDG